MKYASLYATLEYLKRRRALRYFVYGQTKKEPDLWQISSLLWKSPKVQFFSDSFVGYPSLILHDFSTYRTIELVPGKEIDIFPIARFCRGVSSNGDVERCTKSRASKPFGILMKDATFDTCSSCSKKTMNFRCLYQKPRCNGVKVKCRNTHFG